MEIHGAPLHEAIAGYFWLEQMVPEANSSQAAINRYGNKSGQDTKRMTRWKNGLQVPTNQSVGRLAGKAPNAAEFYRTAPYRLLDPSPLTVAEIRDLMFPYHDGDNESPYRFPDDGFGLPNSECGPPCLRRQSIILAYRGDIYAFFATLALVREAEALENSADHLLHLQCLYYCLASLGRFPWARKDFGLLCKAVRLIHASVRESALTIGVNWEIVEGQFLDPRHEPDMSKRRVDAETGFPVSIANPTFLMRPAERGTMPAWSRNSHIGNSRVPEHEEDPLGRGPKSEVEMDESLFFDFLKVMRACKADRHDWEAFIACRSGQATVWLDTGMDGMTKISRKRILNILKLNDLLVDEVGEPSDLAEAFSGARPELDGDSIRERLRNGRVLDTLSQLSV